MEKKSFFSIKVLKNERFVSFNGPLTEEKQKAIVDRLEKQYGSNITLIETTTHIYTPVLTKK